MPFQPYFFNDTPTAVEQITKNSLENEKQSADISALRTDVDGALNELNKNIATVVTNKLNEWSEDGSLRTIINTKKILIVGDSYLAGDNLPSPTTQNYGYLLAYQGFNVSALASSGGGFVATGDHGTFYQIINGYSNGDEDDYTDIFFLGGVNDAYESLSGLKNAIVQTVALARSKFRNAKIHVGYISQLRRADGNPAGVCATKAIYHSASLEALYTYIDNCETMLKNAAYIGADGIHPSVDGQRAIANYLISYIINGQINTAENINAYSFVLNTDMFDTGRLFGNVMQHNNLVRISNFENTSFVTNDQTVYTFNGITSFIMGDIPSNIIWGQSANSATFGNAQFTIPGTVVLIDDNDNEIAYTTPLTVRIVQQTIFLTPQILIDASTYASGKLREITITPFSAVLLADDV